jgi:hypothetical protein
MNLSSYGGTTLLLLIPVSIIVALGIANLFLYIDNYLQKKQKEKND